MFVLKLMNCTNTNFDILRIIPEAKDEHFITSTEFTRRKNNWTMQCHRGQ